MEYTIQSISPDKQRSDCVVVGVYRSARLTPAAERLDTRSDHYIRGIARSGDFSGEVGETLLLHDVPGTLCRRVLLVGCGTKGKFGPEAFGKAVTSACSTLCNTGSSNALFCLTELEPGTRDIHWRVRQAIQASENSLYRFDRLKSNKNTKRPGLGRITFLASKRGELKPGERAIREAIAIARGVELARTLGNLPGNICTPSYLASQARSLARRYKKIKVRVLAMKDMEKLGMGALLSVARGSRQPARFIIIEYPGGRKTKKPVVLVGKGITFDSGGISIKPAAAMDEMKFDMCGAASVLGALTAAASLRLPVNVVGIIPSSENLPDGNASKPGDIVTSMSGQTIEVLNTDAEGRLILCDALTYSERFNPAAVIDIATLTGACVIALGKHASGLLANDDVLSEALRGAGDYTGDRAWPLPLWDDYQDQLNSNFADMANVGGREAGTITAACFLSRFAKKYKWAHLDIAGAAWLSGSEKGATGRPVPLLTQYLLDRARRGQ